MNLDDIRKNLKDEIIKLDETYEYFLTGNPLLDAFIGSGGLPKYQMEYIWGLNSIGKSTLGIQILASYQKQSDDDCIFIYFDKEQSVTKTRLEQLGADVNNLIIVNPSYIEKVGEIVKSIKAKIKSKNKKVDMFAIWDTLIMTQSLEQYEGMGKIGSHARALGDLFKDLDFYKYNLTMLCLDQHREKIGSMWEELAPPSANVVKHKSFLSINGKAKNSKLWDNNDIGRTVTLHTVKSKIISPKRKMEFEMTYVGGYDSILSLMAYLYKEMKLFHKKGGRGCAGCWVLDGFEERMPINEWYYWFMSDDAIPIWKECINHIYNNLYRYDYDHIIEDAKTRINNYYFENDQFHRNRFTSINESLIMKMVDDDGKDNKEVDDINEKIDDII